MQELKYVLISEMQRISIAELLEDEWFKKGYKPPSFDQDDEDITIDDVDAAFSNSKVNTAISKFSISLCIS